MSNAKPVMLRLIDKDGYGITHTDLSFILVSMLVSASAGLGGKSKIEYDDRIVYQLNEE